jgi:hypothetical protein
MNTVRVVGMSRLESLDLKRQFPDAAISFEASPTKDPQLGELATVAVVVVTLAGLKLLAAWLSKNRKNNEIMKTVEVVSADGSRRTETIHLKVSESTTNADIIKAIAPMMDVDLKQLGPSAS